MREKNQMQDSPKSFGIALPIILSSLISLWPFLCKAESNVIIGTPLSVVGDGIVDPDSEEASSDSISTNPHYYISCVPFESGLKKSFSLPDRNSKINDPFPINRFWTIFVKYFVTVDGEQFILGSFMDHKAQAINREVYVLARDWECKMRSYGFNKQGE
jgi:hypothetical protein